MTISILQTLAALPSGKPSTALDLAELGDYLRRTLNVQSEKDRNARHAVRDRLYRDGGDKDMEAVIEAFFDDPVVREKRRKVIPYAKFSNSLKRIVSELSTVYAEPARRFVDGPADQVKYDALMADLCFDEQMDVVNQMLNLHRALIVGPRVRKNADGSREIVIDIATPATTRVVCNPLDTTQPLAWLVSVDMPLVRNEWGAKPAWVLWSDHEWMYLDGAFQPIVGTVIEHGLNMNRWVPISYAAAAMPGFWPGSEGEDLVAAQITIWLAAILMVKETKSNTKQPVVSGDTSAMARNQVSDSDVPIQIPEGVAVTTIDVGTDPGIFIEAADHALKRAGANYGLSMDLMSHQGTQSAEARELMLAPIRERRRKQIKIFRRFERRLATVIARVAEVDAPDLAFNTEGWRINFGETQVLLGEKERLEIFEHKRRLGLTDTVAYKMAEDPDLTEAQAFEDIADHVMVETQRNVLMRPLQTISGSLGAKVPDGGSDNTNTPAAKPGPVTQDSTAEVAS